MKKVIIPIHLKWIFTGDSSLLQRSEIAVITTTSNRETLARHRAERADLIVAEVVDEELPGDELSLKLRVEESLRGVAILLLCRDNEAELRRAASCHANGTLLLPLRLEAFFDHLTRLLNIAERKNFRVLVSIHVEIAQHPEALIGVSRNISATGILVETGRVLNPGERISCGFYLPAGQPIRVSGTVVRSLTLVDGTHQSGIKFDGIDQPTRQTLTEFVESLRAPGRDAAS